MYIPFVEKHIDDILNIRKSAEKACKVYGFSDVQELSNFLFEGTKNARAKRSLKRKIFKPLRSTIPKTAYLSKLKEALNQDEYIYEPILDQEMENIVKWVEKNGKKWKLAESVFHRPRIVISKAYKRYMRGTGKRNINSLEHVCGYILLILKYYPNPVFNVKNAESSPKCTAPCVLKNKLPRFSTQAFNKYRERFSIYGHRFWSLDSYELLFNHVLAHSRPLLLDSLPCLISFRYLSYPVNQLFHPIEYIFRLVYLYVYFINEIPASSTIREYIQFLREKLLVQKESIPSLCFRLKGSRFADIDFCGFMRGCNTGYVKYSEEMDREVAWLLDIERPPDEELVGLIASANANGCQLRLAAEYSRLIPSEMAQSEEMLDEEEWKERWKKKKESFKHLATKYLDEDSEDDGVSKAKETHLEREEGEHKMEKKEKHHHKEKKEKHHHKKKEKRKQNELETWPVCHKYFVCVLEHSIEHSIRIRTDKYTSSS